MRCVAPQITKPIRIFFPNWFSCCVKLPQVFKPTNEKMCLQSNITLNKISNKCMVQNYKMRYGGISTPPLIKYFSLSFSLFPHSPLLCFSPAWLWFPLGDIRTIKKLAFLQGRRAHWNLHSYQKISHSLT